MAVIKKSVLMILVLFMISGCRSLSSLESELADLEIQADEWENKYAALEEKKEAVLFETIMETAAQARESNIKIYTTYIYDGRGNSDSGVQGSGFVFKKDDNFYYALTNFHVIDIADADRAEYTIILNNGVTVFGDVVAEGDDYIDLAVIKFPINHVDIPLTPIDSNTQVHDGDFVLVIGNPHDQQNVVSTSIIEDTDVFLRQIHYEGLIMSYTMNAHGNSGGAVVNLTGELVGVLTWVGEDDTTKFAIPLEKVTQFLLEHQLLDE